MLSSTPKALMITHSTVYWEEGENNKGEGQHKAVVGKSVRTEACQFSLRKGLEWIRDMEHHSPLPHRSRKYILRGRTYQKARKAWKVDWLVCSRAHSSSKLMII